MTKEQEEIARRQFAIEGFRAEDFDRLGEGLKLLWYQVGADELRKTDA